MTSVQRETISEAGEAAIAGEAAAFNAVYEALAPSVFNLVLRSIHDRAIAEDICQEVWVKAHREIHTVRACEALTGWVYRMASRACIDYSRSRAFRDRDSVEISEEMVESNLDNPEAALMRQSDLRSMWEALAAIPPRQSMALYLKQVDDCSYAEIGQILGCPKSAVETLLFRARQGFAAAHARFQADPRASCKMIATTMSVVLDKEGTQIQERAVQAHLKECGACRDGLSSMQRGANGYLWLPMLPVGGLSLDALASAVGGVGSGVGIGRVVSMLLIKGKAAGLAGLTAASVTAAAATGAAAGWTPGPIEALDAVHEIGAGVRQAAVGGFEDARQSLLGGDAERRVTQGDPGVRPDAVYQGPPLAPADSAGPNPPGGLQPPAGRVDPSVLDGLPGLVAILTGGSLGNFVPLLGYLGGALDKVLADPVASLRWLAGDTGDLVDGTLKGATESVDQTLQNATNTLDATVGDATELVGSVTGGSESLGPIADTVSAATNIVGQTTGGVVDTTSGGVAGGMVDVVTESPADPVEETLDDLDVPDVPDLLHDILDDPTGDLPVDEVIDLPDPGVGDVIEDVLDDVLGDGEEDAGCILIFC